jgi:hypothetical protein
VRARFEAVETPLKRTKKSQNARKNLFFLLVGMGSLGMGKNLVEPTA